MAKYMVSSAVTMLKRGDNTARCFETNALDFPTLEEAQIEADRRNAMELAAGHTNVEWYPSEQLDMAEIMRRFNRHRD